MKRAFITIPYHKYMDKVLCKPPSQHAAIRFKHLVPTPGNIFDRKRGFKRFERWYKLPRAAHRLYWRLRGGTKP